MWSVCRVWGVCRVAGVAGVAGGAGVADLRMGVLGVDGVKLVQGAHFLT